MTNIPPSSHRPPTAADQGGQDIGAQDASQGLKTGHMRWVLGISLVLAVAAMSGIWIWSPHNRSPLLGASEAKPAASSPRTIASKPTTTPNPTLP